MILIEITDDFIVETDILIALVVANVAVMFVDFAAAANFDAGVVIGCVSYVGYIVGAAAGGGGSDKDG